MHIIMTTFCMQYNNNNQHTIHQSLDSVEMINRDFRAVQDKHMQYRDDGSCSDSDIVGEFISTCCDKNKNNNSRTPIIVLLNAFNEWSSDFWGPDRFRHTMVSRGLYVKTSNVCGLQLDCFMDIVLV